MTITSMPGTRDILTIVETAYQLRDDEQEWVRATLGAASPHLFDGLGGIACLFDERAQPDQIMSKIVVDGMDPRIMVAMASEFAGGDEADRARSLRARNPIVRLTKLCGDDLRSVAAYRSLVDEIGFEDVVAVRAGNPDGTGAFFCAPLRREQRATREWDARWCRIAAHLAAGMRLQRAASKLAADRASEADAVLTPGGRLLSAKNEARGAIEALRGAAASIDRARSRAGRRDPDEALDGWSALVDGRWSLVDHFERDGKRFVIAVPNVADAPDPRALAPNERAVVQYALMGHSYKLIAYELGIPQGTVATRLISVARKLGVRSRVELIDRWQSLAAARFEEVEINGTPVLVGSAERAGLAPGALTAAEREVADMAARGTDSKSIAKARRCSPRTVANLLQSVYRKLGVRSRAELARRLAQR